MLYANVMDVCLHCCNLQIMDFFNVRDFEIPGYSLPQVVVELHAHLWSCAIDYRLARCFVNYSLV